MARHAEDALRGAGIAQVLDLPLAVAAPETVRTEGLVAREDGQVLDLVAAVVAAVRAVVAYQRPVAEQQQVRVRVEERAARVAAEAVDVPSVPRCEVKCQYGVPLENEAGARDVDVSMGNAYRAQMPFPPRVSVLALATACLRR